MLSKWPLSVLKCIFHQQNLFLAKKKNVANIGFFRLSPIEWHKLFRNNNQQKERLRNFWHIINSIKWYFSNIWVGLLHWKNTYISDKALEKYRQSCIERFIHYYPYSANCFCTVLTVISWLFSLSIICINLQIVIYFISIIQYFPAQLYFDYPLLSVPYESCYRLWSSSGIELWIWQRWDINVN